MSESTDLGFDFDDFNIFDDFLFSASNMETEPLGDFYEIKSRQVPPEENV